MFVPWNGQLRNCGSLKCPNYVWGPSRLLFNVCQVVLSLGVKRPVCDADSPHPSSAKAKNERSYTFTFSICRHGMHRNTAYYCKGESGSIGGTRIQDGTGFEAWHEQEKMFRPALQPTQSPFHGYWG